MSTLIVNQTINSYIFVGEKKVQMPAEFSIKSRLRSFVYAIKGIKLAFITQHNFQIHICLAIVALLLGLLLKISLLEWVSIIIVIGIVLTTELLNTAIELLVDHVSPERNKTAGIIKDLAAGAVLLSAIAALLVGAIIFLPKIINLI